MIKQRTKTMARIKNLKVPNEENTKNDEGMKSDSEVKN